MTELDPRKPLVLDTRRLGRRPGSMVEFTHQVEITQELGTEVIAVPAGGRLDLSVRLESVAEGVLVSGSGSALAVGSCVRCLEPVTQQVEATFQELFGYPDRAAHLHEVGADEDDEQVLLGDLLDLEPVIRDAVVPALPYQPLCRPDCPGLCSECGLALADQPDHQHDTLDPRWASLQALATAHPYPTGSTEKRT